MKLKLEISADSRYSFDRKKIKAALEETLKDQGVEGDVLISLSVVGERKIRELEKKFFNRDEVTDVLSFPLGEGEPMPGEPNINNLGDIVVCYPQAKRQAMQWNRLVDDEIAFLVQHGLLHLLGIHHD